MKVLFVGGTGIISSGSAARALEKGCELWVLNRGTKAERLHDSMHVLTADYRDEAATVAILGDHQFDVVVDFITFTIDQMRQAIRIWSGRTRQYFYISSATVYRKPPDPIFITEDAPLGNSYSLYARNKLACETALREAVSCGFPGVIIRPSLTYADFNLLTSLRSRKAPYSLVNRMRSGRRIVVQGDGCSLWTITHTLDFAKGLVGLFGNKDAIGEAFHITSDEVLDWNRIYTTLAHAAGVEAKIIHMASDFIGEICPDLRDGLLGDHSCSVVFDNSKIKRFVPDFICTIPFEEGAKRFVSWCDADPTSRENADPEWDARMDRLIDLYESYRKFL